MTLRPSLAVVLALACASGAALAVTPQSLSATVGGAPFVSDDDGILLVPVKGSFSLSASTAGASAYPPPKTPIDRLSIRCTAYTVGTPEKFDTTAFQPGLCDVQFQKGGAGSSAPPQAEYHIDKASSDNLFEITASHDKVIEGRFRFQLKDAAGHTLSISDGAFKVEDRQM